MLGDGPGHRLVTAGSEDALVEGLRLVLDPARLPAERAGGVRLRAEVLRCFSWDEVARATEHVYRVAARRDRERPEDVERCWEKGVVLDLPTAREGGSGTPTMVRGLQTG